MPQLTNNTGDALWLASIKRSVNAHSTIEVDAVIAALFADHPLIMVTQDPAPAAPAAPAAEPAPAAPQEPALVAPETVTVEVPAGEHIVLVPDQPQEATQQ